MARPFWRPPLVLTLPSTAQTRVTHDHAKGCLITLEIPSAVRAVRQDPGTETKYPLPIVPQGVTEIKRTGNGAAIAKEESFRGETFWA